MLFFGLMTAVTVTILVTDLREVKGRTPCATHAQDKDWWSWREVDGRRCYYRGRPGKPKDELYWPAPDLPRSRVGERDAPPPEELVEPTPAAGTFEDRWLGISPCRFGINQTWDCR